MLVEFMRWVITHRMDVVNTRLGQNGIDRGLFLTNLPAAPYLNHYVSDQYFCTLCSGDYVIILCETDVLRLVLQRHCWPGVRHTVTAFPEGDSQVGLEQIDADRYATWLDLSLLISLCSLLTHCWHHCSHQFRNVNFCDYKVLWNAVSMSPVLNVKLLLCEGFACFKCFFENVNQNENKLKKTSTVLVIFMHCILYSVLSVHLFNIQCIGLFNKFDADLSFQRTYSNIDNFWLLK